VDTKRHFRTFVTVCGHQSSIVDPLGPLQRLFIEVVKKDFGPSGWTYLPRVSDFNPGTSLDILISKIEDVRDGVGEFSPGIGNF
jgi:hypothetical protein